MRLAICLGFGIWSLGFLKQMKDLIDTLIEQRYLKTSSIIDAFKKIDRADFLPEEIKDEAGLNIPLSIGYGQTISQPLTVAFMLELLEPKPGDKILDIGSGSGWTTALLAHIVSQKRNPKSQILNSTQIPNPKPQNLKCKVIAIEIIPELMEFGRKNVSKYNFIEKGIVNFICANGRKGFIKEAPFDKILVSAAVDKIPQTLKEQLKIGGRLVIPVKSSIFLVIRKDRNRYEEKEFYGFAFVPLVKE